MTNNFEEYLAFMDKYEAELKLVLENEREKRRALLESDMDRLNTMLQFQQAETMKLKTFEAKRIELQIELGLGDVVASELLPKIEDEDDRSKLEAVFSRIADLADEIKEQNDRSVEIAETNLRLLNKVMKKSDILNDEGLYSPKSGYRNNQNSGSSFNGSI